MMHDFHTHNLLAPPGTAIVNLPEEWTLRPDLFRPQPGALYSAGIHPWWTVDAERTRRMVDALPRLLEHPQVVRVGECGLDKLCGAPLQTQIEVFEAQAAMAEAFGLPMTLHIVRAFDVLLRLKKQLRPTVRWTVHGFRGGPALARQLLAAGLDLSFGLRFNAAAYDLTPAERRWRETDELPEAGPTWPDGQ